MTRTKTHPYARREVHIPTKQCGNLCQRSGLIQNCVNSVQMLFSKMKDSVLNLLTPSWLSDFLADLHISSPSDADSDRTVLKTDVEAVVSEHRSNGIHGVQGQQGGSGNSFLQGEGSRPPDIDLVSQDELQGEGQMMSLLNEEDEFWVPGSEYRSALLPQQPGRFILADHPSFKCSGSSSCVVGHRRLSERRYSEHKRKTFDHKENVSLWKKQKTDQLKLYEVMHGGLVTDALPYKQLLRDGYARNTPLFPSFHRDNVEKLNVKAKPSQLRDRKIVTESTSRRIQDVIDGKPKPLYMIIPDLQNDLTAPKLKFFIPAVSQVKKPVPYYSQSPVNTGISVSQSPLKTGAFVSQSTVNTGASISMSPLNARTFISQSQVNTGTFIGQSQVNTRTFISQSSLNTGASISLSPVSTGACISQSPVNTGAALSMSPVNTSAFISQSPLNKLISITDLTVNTGMAISQSQVNTRTVVSECKTVQSVNSFIRTTTVSGKTESTYVMPSETFVKDLKFQPVWQGLNLQPNKAIPARGSSVMPNSMVEGTAASAGTSTSAVFKFPAQISIPLSTAKSYLGTSSSYTSTSPLESRSEPFVHSRENVIPWSFRQDATSHASRLSATSSQFLSANDQSSRESTAFVTASNSGIGLGSDMALTSNREQLDNTCITTSGFKFDSPASYVGQPVTMVASGPKTTSGFTFTPSFTSTTNNSKSQSLKFGSALQSCMSASSTSAFKFSDDSSVTQTFKFDTNSSNGSSLFDAKLRSTADSIPSVPLSSELDRSVSSFRTASLDSRSCSASTFYKSDSTPVLGVKYDTAFSLTRTSQFDTNVASTMSSTSTSGSSFSTMAASAVSSTAVSSMSRGPVSSSVINAKCASSFDSRPGLQLRINSSTTQGFEFKFAPASSNNVLKNSRSETTPFSTIAYSSQTLTASVFSLDSELSSTTPPSCSAITPDVKASATDMVANSDTNSSLSIDMPSFEDINSNASVPAVGFGQPFQQGYHPDVYGSESMATEEFSSNVPTISPAVADTPPVHAGDVTSKPQAMAVSDTEYRSPDQIFPQAVGQGDAVGTRSPEKSPQRTPAVHTAQGSPAFHSQQANNFIDHASYLVSKINTTKLDNHPELVAKNEEPAKKNRIKRLPEVIGGQIGIDNTVPTVNAVSMANAVPTVNTVPMVTVDTSDVNIIPEPMYPPEPEQIPANVRFKKVFCDIETTSLTMHTEIVQIAAVCGDETFDQYILPMRKFDQGASKVTGLTCDGGVLYHHGIPVRTLDLKSALERFLGWLDPLKPCVFVGHNFKNFDYPRIYRAFTKFNLVNAFHQIVLGFVDSYPLFKDIYPEEKSYKQESLVAKYVKETYDAHNALGDVKSLKKLLTVSDKITHEVLCMYSYSANWYVDFHEYKAICNKNADTFKEIITNKILSKSTIDKIAGSGLEMKHLKLIYKRDGPEALTDLLVSRASFSKATVGKLLTFLASD